MAKGIFTLYLSVLVLFLCSCLASAPAQEAAEGRVVGGYFEEWDVRYSGYTMAALEKSGAAAKLTHLIYAFGNVTPGPSPVCAIDDPKAAWQDASILGVDGKPFSGSIHGNFAGILELKRLHPRLKTLISLGGQAGNVSGFTAAAASPAARRALIASSSTSSSRGILLPAWRPRDFSMDSTSTGSFLCPPTGTTLPPCCMSFACSSTRWAAAPAVITSLPSILRRTRRSTRTST